MISGLRVLGFSFLLTWFSASGFLSSTPSAAHSDFLTLLVFTVALFVAALIHKAIAKHLACNWKSELIIGVLACIGTILPSLFDEGMVIYGFCPLVTGIGLAFLSLQWALLFSELKTSTVITQTIVSQMIMSLLHFANSFLSPLPEACVRGLLLIASAATLGILLSKTQRNNQHLAEDKASNTHDALFPQHRIQWKPFIRFIFAINLWGIAINQIYNIYRYCSPIDFSSLSMPAAIIEVIFLGCLLVLVILKAIKDTSLYTIIASTALLSFLLVPILGFENPIPFFAIFLGYCTLSILTWTLSARMCEAYHIDPVIVYGCSIGSFLGMQIVIARAIAPDMFTAIASLPAQQNVLCLIGACMSFIAYQLVLNKKSALWLSNHQPANQQQTPTDPMPESAADPFTHWEQIARNYGLTPRESEVVLLFARGRSYERIQETLVISRGTVNYHMSNAYRKLGISSRQELLDLIDSNTLDIVTAHSDH
ncbi:helix-turn-helix transcriptional regulator [Adlercreutzia agrestimuris]|uniref:helix-turn-helix transcriptional regulator n=1 Tax=Adlercreutzia agrestimuris TaxID=2941324 RepID=UPI00204124CF|nr:LuxR family transcriptional regulator [Adlercreutzia agrestimuris]